ncbi:hypothetical protein OROHE_006175 [Orobanche hederae]
MARVTEFHIGKIPLKWRGVCMEGSDFKKSNCNRKLIGARFYSDESQGSPRDLIVHGTLTAREGRALAQRQVAPLVTCKSRAQPLCRSARGMMLTYMTPHPYPTLVGEHFSAYDLHLQRESYTRILDSRKVAGKIVVCMNDERDVSRTIKRLIVEDAKGKWIIIIDRQGDITPFDLGTYPFAQVGQTLGSQILHSINSTKSPIATILEAKETKPFKPSPVVVSFSSRDITAPGVAIIAAIVPKIRSEYSAPDNKPSSFGISSGTSMACPHVTGAMAFIKSVHPQWSFSVIKSAMMTIGILGHCTFADEPALDPFSHIFDELSVIAQRLWAMLIAEGFYQVAKWNG